MDSPPTLPLESGNPPLAQGAIQIIVICSVFCPLAIIAVILRIWARSIKKQHLSFNDYAIFVALALNCGQTALLIYVSVAGGIGYHMSELAVRWPQAAVTLAKCYVAAEPLWISTNSFIKFSILHLYMKIFVTKTFQRICYGLMAITTCYFISTFVRMFFLCTPLEAFWNPAVPGAHCLNLTAAYISVSVINLALDLTILALPMPYVWNLHLPTSKKIAISAIFSIGILINVVTALRVEAVTRLDLADTSYTVTPDGIWSELEPCLGIVNACLPVLQPVAAKVAGTSFIQSFRGRTSGNATYLLKAGGRRARSRFDMPNAGTTASIGSKPRFKRLKDDAEYSLAYPMVTRNADATVAQGRHPVPPQGIQVTSDIVVERS